MAAPMQWNTGQKASAVLHGVLILWIMLFDLFAAPDDPMIPEATEVTIISAADFALITAPASVAQPAPPPEPAPPAPAPTPEPASAPVARTEAIVPPQPVAPPPAAAPITPPPPVVEPDAQSDRPQAAVIAPNVTPDASLRPVQRQADRVAPTPAPTPDPQVTIAPRDQAAVTPDAAATVDAQEAQDATQREAAATEIVTEVTQISDTEPARRTATAPEVSLRPQRRPRPQPVQPAAQPAPEPAPAPEAAAQPAPEPAGPSASAVEDALAQALASLSQSDLDMILLLIESNWNWGGLSTDALNVDMTLGFELDRDARLIPSSITILQITGGSAAAQQAAFEAARQALFRAGEIGFGLPPESYDAWRYNEFRFNPSEMSTR